MKYSYGKLHWSYLELLETRHLLAADLEVSISTSIEDLVEGDATAYQVAIENLSEEAVQVKVDVSIKPFGPELNVDDLDGNNGFRVATRPPEPCDFNCPFFPRANSLGDINGDSAVDFLVANSVVFGGNLSSENGVADLRQLDGKNGFVIESTLLVNGRIKITSADAGDFNGDGFNDVLFGLGRGTTSRNVNYLLFGGENVGASGVVQLTDLPRILGSDGDFGRTSVSSAGDFNGDGFDDILIGDGGASPQGRTRAGEAYLIFGRPSLSHQSAIELSALDGTNGFTLQGVSGGSDSRLVSVGDEAGASVGAADVNGDGYSDLLVAAPGAVHRNRSTIGKVYVMFGGPSPNGNQATLRLSSMRDGRGFIIAGKTPYHYFGSAVAGAGDLNGDGYQDVVMGTDTLETLGARAFVLLGSADPGHVDLGLPNDRVIELQGSSTGHGQNRFGGIGDFNHDGIDDLVVGDYFRESGCSGVGCTFSRVEGSAYVLFGAADFTRYDSLDLTMDLNGENGFRVRSTSVSWVGLSSDGLGDVNDDGIDDFIVESWFDEFSKRSYVIFGADQVDEVFASQRLTIAPGETVDYDFVAPVTEETPGDRVKISTELIPWDQGRRPRVKPQIF